MAGSRPAGRARAALKPRRPAGRVALSAAGAPRDVAPSRLRGDLARLARMAAEAAGRPVTLEVALLDDAGMDALHRRHLGVAGTTDVLSYALEDGPGALHGALALGWQVARREAARRGHPPYHEALLYAVHGTLHLLGHDDHASRDRARMRRAEREWLAALGLGDVFGGRPRR